MYNQEQWQSLNQLLDSISEASLRLVDSVHSVQQLVQELELEHTYTSNMNSHVQEEEISLTNLNEELE